MLTYRCNLCICFTSETLRQVREEVTQQVEAARLELVAENRDRSLRSMNMCSIQTYIRNIIYIILIYILYYLSYILYYILYYIYTKYNVNMISFKFLC